jgi:hypothetical protein
VTVTPVRVGAILGAAVATTLALRFVRDFPWTLAALVGVAVGVLVLSTFNSGDRVRRAMRR